MACQCPIHSGLPDADGVDARPFWQHAVAGSAAGVMEHVGMFPIDTVKTRIQASPVSVGVMRTFREVLQERGPVGLMRGSMTIGVACLPAHCSLFVSFEYAKGKLLNLRGNEHQPLRSVLCGAIGALAHDSVITPADVVKQRLQLGGYRGFTHCVTSMVQNEGPSAFFRSLPATLLMNIPNTGLLVMANEFFKRSLNLHKVDKAKATHTPLYFACAGLSGAFASALTTPLDVVKTRLQTQGHFAGCVHAQESTDFTLDSRYQGIRSTSSAIYRAEGLPGFFRGLGSRVALATPAAAMCWGTYEVILMCFSHPDAERTHLEHHRSHSHGHSHVHSHGHGHGHNHAHGHSNSQHPHRPARAALGLAHCDECHHEDHVH